MDFSTWSSIKRLVEVSDSLGLPSGAFDQHFHISLDGDKRFLDDGVLVTGFLLGSWKPHETRKGSRVVIRLRYSDYYATAQHASTLRILFAALCNEPTGPVIDVTGRMSMVATTVDLQSAETLVVAELFCGSFCGWSQAAYQLHRLGRPLYPKVLLDAVEGCFPSARLIHKGLRKVSSLDELQALLQGNVPVFVHASLTDHWWLRSLSAPCPHLWCISPPCQPWSTASAGPGLEADDGRLILHLSSLLRALRPPAFCLEQVVGFVKHQHYPFIKDLWHSLDYRLVCANHM